MLTDRIRLWTKNWMFYHLLFWSFILFTMMWDLREYAPHDVKGYSLSVLIRVALQAFLLYLNLFFLIPKIYPKSKILYWLIVLLSIAVFILLYRTVYFMTTTLVSEVYSAPRIDEYFGKSFLAIRTLLFSYSFKFLQDWYEQEKRINQIKVDQLSTELRFLRAQVNPHFLFNTLNNLYGLALQKSDKTAEIIMRLADIMDYMIYDSIDMKVLLKKDVDNLINYVEIEKIRQGNDARIQFVIDGAINSQIIIPMLMLPLFENAFTHGIYKEPKNAFLDARLTILEKEVVLVISNNKNNVSSDSEKSHGIGLSNLKKRLDLHYLGQHELRIDEQPDIFKVYLMLILS